MGYIKMGKRSENEGLGTAKFRGQEWGETDPAEETEKTSELSCEQNQDGGASQKPRKERISGRREWSTMSWAAEISAGLQKKVQRLL